jgi:hypothetical protein
MDKATLLRNVFYILFLFNNLPINKADRLHLPINFQQAVENFHDLKFVHSVLYKNDFHKLYLQNQDIFSINFLTKIALNLKNTLEYRSFNISTECRNQLNDFFNELINQKEWALRGLFKYFFDASYELKIMYEFFKSFGLFW